MRSTAGSTRRSGGKRRTEAEPCSANRAAARRVCPITGSACGEVFVIAYTMHFDGDEAVELENATVEDLTRWIKELDGVNNTIVAVTLDNGSSAEVSGGSDGRYKVDARVNGRFFDLASGLSTSYKRIPLAYCEDVCWYPEKYVVSLEQALASMRHFCLTGELSPEFSWSSASDYYPYEPETRAEGEPDAPDDGGGR